MASMGAVRGTGENCKSYARLICPDVDQQAHEGWDTEYIRASCKVQPCSEAVKVLGTYLGHAHAADEGLRRTLVKVANAREGIATLDDLAAELVLT